MHIPGDQNVYSQPSRHPDPLPAEGDRRPHASSASPATHARPTFKGWKDRTFSSLSIANKIILGYGISLGIAVLGTTTGLLVGDYYEAKARHSQQVAHKQAQLLSQLQVTVLQLRPEREFLPSIWEESRFRSARTESFERLNDVENLLTEVRASADLQTMSSMQGFLTGFETEIDAYRSDLEAIVGGVDPDTIDATVASQVERQITGLVDSPTYLRLFRFSIELTEFVEQAEEESLRANLALDRAGRLETQIILGSMALSIAIAGLLSIYISRTITRPIKQVTAVAKEVTEQGDFSLRAPVTTQDEVGVLSVALNDLIQRIADHTRELRETQTHLIQSEKMSSLGQMVAGVAHEINNPVNFIYGNLVHTRDYTENLLRLIHLFRDYYPTLDEPLKHEIEAVDLEFIEQDLPKLLDSMKIGADRIRQIVLSLRNFSRLDEAEMKAVDLHEGLDSTLLLLSNRLKLGIHIAKSYGDLPLVECYPAQINQVFMNIVSNAIDSLLDCGKNVEKTVTITTNVRSTNAIVQIHDNGIGIPEMLLGKLFDPFFTTKPIGRGTGLGLAISYQIIHKHHGEIKVDSEPGVGTTFSIIIPIKEIGFKK
ncbi:sensor histidine kinase [Vacuolonema iberomarrocanum]|uniref:sensor histidine kinase n=1 Tax=Vacuolonema iberomarrocanum TaxID=3454632 RepID=UPI0019F123CA|nr:HAMP domain-containing histidine kinase [filamentous cyanobacterium LEGE 07170]